jgi:hypothetical protein
MCHFASRLLDAYCSSVFVVVEGVALSVTIFNLPPWIHVGFAARTQLLTPDAARRPESIIPLAVAISQRSA